MTSLAHVCVECLRGNHRHDRYVSDGTDAGCPFTVHGGECRCAYRKPVSRDPAVCPTCGQPRLELANAEALP